MATAGAADQVAVAPTDSTEKDNKVAPMNTGAKSVKADKSVKTEKAKKSKVARTNEPRTNDPRTNDDFAVTPGGLPAKNAPG
jgi:hypothetical protein